MRPHQASFRDPSGYMFYDGDVLRRAINPIYFKQYNALKDSGFFNTLIKNKLLIPHTQTTVSDKQIVITPEPIAFITNPYEWSFEQYKHAALHTLKVHKYALSKGFILKDASATAIYGSRAANGVVLITTKKGKTGDLKFNFSSRSSSFTPIDFVDVLNATQFKYAVQATGVSDYISRLGSNDTDWQKEIYETARAQNNSFSVSGTL